MGPFFRNFLAFSRCLQIDSRDRKNGAAEWCLLSFSSIWATFIRSSVPRWIIKNQFAPENGSKNPDWSFCVSQRGARERETGLKQRPVALFSPQFIFPSFSQAGVKRILLHSLNGNTNKTKLRQVDTSGRQIFSGSKLLQSSQRHASCLL